MNSLTESQSQTYSCLKQPLTLIQSEAIHQFLLCCKGFTYFQSPGFFEVCRTTPNLEPGYIVAWRGTSVIGIMLYFLQKQVSIPILDMASSRIMIWGGPLVIENNPETVEGLLRVYRQCRPFALYTQIRNFTDTAAWSDKLRAEGFIYEDHLNFLVDLTLPIPTLWSNISTKRRNQIRRSQKEGCSFQIEHTREALSFSYQILQQVYKRARLPLPPLSFFEQLRRQAGEQSGLCIFTIRYQEVIIGCMLAIIDKTAVYDFYAGALSEHYKKYPNDLLPWAIFEWAKEKGYEQFDFGGAGKPLIPYGVRDYKKQFGGQMVNFGRYEHIHVPKLFSIGKHAFRLWQQLKRP